MLATPGKLRQNYVINCWDEECPGAYASSDHNRYIATFQFVLTKKDEKMKQRKNLHTEPSEEK